MSLSLFFLAAALVAPGSDAIALRCDLALPDTSQFRFSGHFNQNGLRSNLADLIKVGAEFTPEPQGITITTDGTDHRRWQVDNPKDSEKFDAALTRYGSEVGVLIVERRKFVGRHWVRRLVGVGLCDIGSQAGESGS